jgi:hypothetical protein
VIICRKPNMIFTTKDIAMQSVFVRHCADTK